jgi:peptidoglycan-N-acetylmuramic acid deacetylase
MNKPKNRKADSKNVLWGTIIVFLLFVTWYIAKTQADTDGYNNATNNIRVQQPENQSNSAPAADHGAQNNGGQTVATGDSSGQVRPVFTGDAAGDKHGWGFTRNEDHLQPGIPASYTAMLSRNGAYWIGSPDKKVVYLTFDEGYENGYTASILDSLKANNVKAAFFVTGHYLDSQPELVRRMVAEGHIVGNHTDTHPSLPSISNEQIKEEIRLVEQKYEAVTGRRDMIYFRPPQGEFSERTLASAWKSGYHSIFWSMAFADWVPLPDGSQEAYQSVMDNTHNGALILLHAVSKDNTEAMDKILKGIKAQGYSFGTLDEMVK